MNLQPWDYWAAGQARRPRAARPSRWRRSRGCWSATRTIRARSTSTSTPSRPRPRPSGPSPTPTGSGGLMPGAGHLVHMPAHIYYRVGRYLDSLEANIAAVKADEALIAAAERAAGLPLQATTRTTSTSCWSRRRWPATAPTAVEAAEKLGRLIAERGGEQMGWVAGDQAGALLRPRAVQPDPATVLALPDPGDDFPFVRRAGATPGPWRRSRAATSRRRPRSARRWPSSPPGSTSASSRPGRCRPRRWWPSPARWSTAASPGPRAARAGTRPSAEAAAIQDRLPYMEPP